MISTSFSNCRGITAIYILPNTMIGGGGGKWPLGKTEKGERKRRKIT